MKVYPLRITIDQKGNVLDVGLNNEETWILEGECSRCGKCCERGKCESYAREILNGIDIAKCEAQWSKPWQCRVYPTNPYDGKEMVEDCGYSWRRIS